MNFLVHGEFNMAYIQWVESGLHCMAHSLATDPV